MRKYLKHNHKNSNTAKTLSSMCLNNQLYFHDNIHINTQIIPLIFIMLNAATYIRRPDYIVICLENEWLNATRMNYIFIYSCEAFTMKCILIWVCLIFCFQHLDIFPQSYTERRMEFHTCRDHSWCALNQLETPLQGNVVSYFLLSAAHFQYDLCRSFWVLLQSMRDAITL